MRLTQLTMALAVAITASSAAQAQQFSEVVSFGDSLTDAGNVALIDGNPYTAVGNSWTTNPDSVYAQYVSEMFGLGAQTNSLSGGTNYAFAGACAIKNGTATLAGPFTCYLPFPSATDQITAYLTAKGGVADPNAIYTVWAGANDVMTGAAISAGAAQAYAGQAAVTSAGLAGKLLQAGAKTVVVFNLPDFGKLPTHISAGPAAATGATALTTIYNDYYQQALATLPDGIVAINVFGLFNEVLANPGLYGFTNTTGMACTTGPGIGGAPTSGACGPAGSGAPWTYAAGTNDTYLFADGIHPTGGMHRMLANVVYGTLTAPGIVSLAPEVAMQSAFNHSTSIGEALDAEWAAGSEVGKVRGYTAVQFGQTNIDATGYTPALDGDSMDLNIGATYRVSEGFTFGVAATLGNNTGDAGSAGEFDGTTVLLGLFGQYEVNGLYGRLSFSGGNTDMDISRNIFMGPTTRVEQGNTGITQQIGSLEAGYVFKAENFTHGPFAGVEITNNEVEGYDEEGTSSTAMRFDDFSRDSNMTTLGYQFSGKFGGVQPFARVAWVTETNTDQTFVRGGTASMPGNFSLGGYAPTDDSFIDWNVGASMRFAESFDGFLSYRGRTGNDQQDNGTFSIGVRKTF